jgi:hypothetical protein
MSGENLFDGWRNRLAMASRRTAASIACEQSTTRVLVANAGPGDARAVPTPLTQTGAVRK